MLRPSWMRSLTRAAIAAAAALAASGAFAQQVLPNPAVLGRLRFTRYSDSIMRAEYAPESMDRPDGAPAFTDAATVVVPERPRPDGLWERYEHAGAIVLSSPPWMVRVRDDSRPPTADTLEIRWSNNRAASLWHPGDPDPGNLGGTVGALDGVGENGLPQLPPGLLSRDGYWVINDSASPAIDPDTGFPAGRAPGGRYDVYLCRYGRAYGRGLRDATRILGTIPLPPKWAFGAWYSRYWPYSQQEEVEIVRGFRDRGIPLDVLVIDVDWHLHGWEGYDWNRDHFPDPEGFLDWTAEQGLHVSLNNHPGKLPPEDSHYPAVREAIGLGPVPDGETPGDLPINLVHPDHAEAFFELLHRPLQDQGIDFWWIDGHAGFLDGMNGQMWSNHAYYQWTEQARDARGLVLGRYGGLGSHRYPVLFSGDTYAHWGVLDFEIGFTATAGNVLAAYWSHDIGGFHGVELDPDLYLRWVQFGAFSPVFRLHSNHGERLPWAYGDEVERISREFIRLRYRLVPYLYSLARETTDTGMPICRPMYLAFPNIDEAYEHPGQYLLGDRLLVAPVAAPPGVDGLSAKELWIPPGAWHDFWSDAVVTGPRRLVERVPRDRIPVYVRGGAIIPSQPVTEHLNGPVPDELTVDFYATADGAFPLYDDDGDSLDWRNGAFANTPMRMSRDPSGDLHRCEIGPAVGGSANGTFPGMPAERSWTVRVHGRARPDRVTINDRELPCAGDGEVPRAGDGWSWDADRAMVIILTGPVPVDTGIRVELSGRSDPARFLAAAELRAFARRIAPLMEPDTRDPATVDGADAEVAASVAAAARAAVAEADRSATRLLTVDTADPDRERALVTQLRRNLTVAAAGDPAVVGLAEGVEASVTHRWRDGMRRIGLVSAVGRVPPVPAGRWVPRWDPPSGWTVTPGDLVRNPGHARATAELTAPDLLHPGEYVVTVTWRWEGAGEPVEVRRDARIRVLTPRAWRVVGPFPNPDNSAVVTPIGPETETPAPWPGVPGPLDWVDWPEESAPLAFQTEPVVVDFRPAVSADNWIAAVAETWLHAETDTPVRFAIGSDDGMVVTLNDHEIFRFDGRRVAVPGEDSATGTLRPGWNRLRVKLTQVVGDWRFHLQLTDPDGAPLRGVRNAASPPEPRTADR